MAHLLLKLGFWFCHLQMLLRSCSPCSATRSPNQQPRLTETQALTIAVVLHGQRMLLEVTPHLLGHAAKEARGHGILCQIERRGVVFSVKSACYLGAA